MGSASVMIVINVMVIMFDLVVIGKIWFFGSKMF